ncbi:nitroreductase family deazaflavin-dependent oxidoreductase [Rhabdothermincola salaria]|uniref:nitroreductase family deazaflavin-dependent oxidoreductase n=1 Tax=Rhabdothermincola salaria TaxID=2903142 RepID=UPI001E3FF883|nr:nitroreductase family deazaflavin-dependent oxidoreductase [Rhabdothermincola salaria]MCD9622875.1 nitroreductase family deazaflavin-dependent oxidoreductase [Rhabdothermincola salaria]
MSDAPDPNDWNEQVIAEFRANDGKVGGAFEGAPMVLLHHKGAKTGTERVTPLMARVDGDKLYVFASKAGAPDNPDWYHNLRAHPETTIEFGSDPDVSVRVVELEGADRDRVWEAQKADWPQFGGYEESTDRTIPVLELQRR